MASILEIKAMGSILERKSRGRIWNSDTSGERINPRDKKKKLKKRKQHIHKNWDIDLWD